MARTTAKTLTQLSLRAWIAAGIKKSMIGNSAQPPTHALRGRETAIKIQNVQEICNVARTTAKTLTLLYPRPWIAAGRLNPTIGTTASPTRVVREREIAMTIKSVWLA